MSGIDEDSLIRRIALRVIPLLMLGYIVAYIDRQNVSFAKLQMVHDMHLSETAYGLGASLFFLGYLLLEVPSNLALYRFGARRWLTRVMLSWGVVTILLAYAKTPTAFYILRFLLGAAEAGFYPGILFYLTLWFPLRHRGRLISYFVLGSIAANFLGSIIGGVMLDLDGLLGLRGWQWCFWVTGIPAITIGFALLRSLPDRPAEARFLSAEEKTWLQRRLQAENDSLPVVQERNPLRAILERRVLFMCVWFMFFTLSAYGFSYWLPTVVKSFGVSNTVNGFLNAIPWLAVACVLWWVPRRSGRGDNPINNILWSSLIGAACFLISYVVPGAVPKFVALCIAVCCIFVAQPCFWTLPGQFLAGANAAAGIAAINSVGNLGGFFGQLLVPAIHDATGSIIAPMLFLAGAIAIRGLLTLPALAALRPQSEEAVMRSADP
jgi:MFS family permease